MEHSFDVMKICVTEYVRYVASLDASMRAIEADIACQNARLDLMGVSLGERGGAANRDALPDGVIKLMELREKWSEEYAQLADDLERARELCEPLHANRRAVWLHFAERMTWAEVGRAIGYSERNAKRIAETGIRELYALMPEEWRRDPIPNAAPQ